ncbi:IS1380 family transposase [Desulfonatronum parangueonense]
MVSSYAVKMFFNSIPLRFSSMFRMLLMRLFVWRLNISKPKLIVINIDAMVMDNDDASKRVGVEPTYKKVCGFAPLQMTWGRFIIDAIFRSGKKHSNHGNDTAKMIHRAVKLIRNKYRKDVPIIVRMDSGYCDQKLFAEMERLQIGYICGGRFLPDVKSYISSLPQKAFDHHYGKNDEDIWEYCEFGDRRSTWKRFRRAIFWRPLLEEKRFFLPGARPGTMIYNNLGMGQAIDEQLKKSGYEYLTKSEEIISSYHQRGTDELVHRCLKDFGIEQLPFKNFAPNAAMYYTMLLGFFLFETFKEDVSNPVVPISATPTTLRRKLVDIAGKIVRTAKQVKLKVNVAVMEALNFKELWERCAKAPRLLWT